MTALATLFNPDGPDDQILTFFNDKQAQLGFELVDALGGLDVTYSSADDNSKGVIRNPSQLAAVHFQRLVRVYAISDSDSEIVLISPGFKDLDLATETKYSSLAACSDGADSAWLYYLKDNPGGIIEYDLANQVPNPLNITNIMDGTSLAACYDPIGQTRYLICQSNNTGPFLYRCVGSNTDQIQNSDIAEAKTPIAVCANPTKTQIQLYFRTTADKRVHRISWDPTHSYSDSSTVHGPDMDDFTTIAVSATPDGKNIHVFYIYLSNDSTRTLAHCRDTWHIYS